MYWDYALQSCATWHIPPKFSVQSLFITSFWNSLHFQTLQRFAGPPSRAPEHTQSNYSSQKKWRPWCSLFLSSHLFVTQWNHSMSKRDMAWILKREWPMTRTSPWQSSESCWCLITRRKRHCGQSHGREVVTVFALATNYRQDQTHSVVQMHDSFYTQLSDSVKEQISYSGKVYLTWTYHCLCELIDKPWPTRSYRLHRNCRVYSDDQA